MHRSPKRTGRRLLSRWLAATAVVLIAGLGAVEEAFATEIPEPPPLPVVEPELAMPPVPIPELPPELLEPPVVETHVDADNVDVSVRVLSPESDGGSTGSPEAVISPVTEGDITETVEDASPQAAADPDAEPAGPVDTNVSIRILSPGDDASLERSGEAGDGGGDEAGGAPRAAAPGRPPASTTQAADDSHSPQYQDLNSRYQSGAQIGSDPWNWVWILTVDCAGDPASSSVDSGSPASLAWSWEWIWEWGCSDAPAQPAPPDQSPAGSPPLAPERAPPEALTTSPPSSPEPWSWNWTFTFCGKTTTYSTQAGAGTPLTWTWSWAWNWTCPAAPQAATAADPAPEAAPAPPLLAPPAFASTSGTSGDPGGEIPAPADAPAFELAPVWLPILPLGFDDEIAGKDEEIAGMTVFVPTFGAPREVTIELAISAAIPPFAPVAATVVPLPVTPFPPGAAPPPRGSPTPTSTAAPFAPQTPAPTNTLGHVPERAATSAKTAPTNAKASRPRATHARSAPLPDFPAIPRSRHGLGSTSAGGVGSSAVLFGVVALAGFVLLAAPRPGRRIRVARELSLRSLDASPIDHPG